MLVYGKRARRIETASYLSRMSVAYATLMGMPSGIERHGRLVGVLIQAGQLMQALDDARMEAAGQDDVRAQPDLAMDLLMYLASIVLQSWDEVFEFVLPPENPIVALAASTLPPTLLLRQPEGYAYYAVYPEAYAAAVRMLGLSRALVIGLRSIGTSVAAITAAALHAPAPTTLRPVGHPFKRKVSVSPGLARQLADAPHIPRVVVDEGPGLSGSSFGAALDWLIQAGIAEGTLMCLPSTDCPPGAMAGPDRQAQWQRMRRAVASFETLQAAAKAPWQRLEFWFADLVGAPTAPLQDISGGLWRAVRGVDVPAMPGQERRKFLLTTAKGRWLLKFAGLGDIGAAKFDRACQLARAGWCQRPLAYRHGFIIEPWLETATLPAAEGSAFVPHIGAYLGWRASHFRCTQGASLDDLRRMARHNIAEALGDSFASDWDFTASPGATVMRIDGRLHRWEWLSLPDGRLLKTDAIDHEDAHDLVGAQDVTWDIAGAIVEFDLVPNDAERLCRIIEHTADIAIDRRLAEESIVYYCAFQLGLWTQYATIMPERYRRHVLLSRPC